MSDTPFTIAVVGAGGIAGAHADAAEKSAGRVRIGAVADPNPSAREALAAKTGARAFTSAEELLEQASPDGLVICTPPSARVEIIERALERGVAVLAEKPIAHTLEDAQRLASCADDHPQVVAAVGYCHRFTPAVLEMKRMVADGAIGRLTRFENVFACHFPAMRDKWMSDPAASGGGSFIDTGCHSLDLFHFLVGPGSIEALVADRAWSGRGESSATCVVRCDDNGVAGVILSGWLEPARFTVSLVGTEGMLSYDYERPTEIVRRPSEGPAETIEIETHEVRFARQLDAFAEAVREGTESDLASFEDGVRVAEVVDAALMLGSKVI